MPDRDDQARVEAKATLGKLRERYWAAKKQIPPADFDDLFDLRTAYEDAVVEFAGLEGKLLCDDVLTSTQTLVSFQDIRKRMEDLGQDLPTPAEMAPAAFGAFHKAEFAKWKKILEDANVRSE